MSSYSSHSKQIRDYFFSSKPVIKSNLIIWGALVLLCSICIISAALSSSTQAPEGMSAAGFLCTIIGLGLIGLPIYTYITAKKQYVETSASDKDMDQWLTDDIKNIIEKDSLEKLGIDKSEIVAEPLYILGPVYWSVSGIDDNDIQRRLSNDGTHFKYSCYNIQVFHLTENYLANYGCYYNWLKNTPVNESTNEFFYKDVVSVKTLTSSTAYTLRDGFRLENSQAFQLKLSGDEVTVVINAANLKTSGVMESKVDQVVQSIRTLLRQKKS